MLCICSPAGQEKFFLEVGVPVATRTTAPPKLNASEQAAFIEKVKALAPPVPDRTASGGVANIIASG
jgi:hypothetical protein